MTQSSNRRQFLKLSSASALAAFTGTHKASADDAAVLYARFVPARKGLDAKWVGSLVQEGHPADAPIMGSKAAGTLDKIGMTVGGIGCGTVYLGGDGRLFVWDIFNQPHEGVVPQNTSVPQGMENIMKRPVRERDGANYVNPPTPDSFPTPFRQGFELLIDGKTRRFQASDWAEVAFDGRWPLGQVDYRDPSCPLDARLTAWSPFIPLQLDDSNLPVTVLEITLRNPGGQPVSATCRGVLENAACLHTAARHQATKTKTTRTLRLGKATLLSHGIEAAKQDKPTREDIVFADFEGEDYGSWKTEGKAFGKGPAHKGDIPAYQGDLGMVGKGVVNSHSTAPGKEIGARDGATGTLISPAFTIARKFIRFRIGGGNHKGKTCLNLLVDGKVVRSATGRANNTMHEDGFDVAEFVGKEATLQLVDAMSGGWGNIGLDHVVFSDAPPTGADTGQLEDALDYGTMVLATLGKADSDERESLSVAVEVPADGERTVRFLLAWHFPNLAPLPGLGRRKRHYQSRFTDATAVASHVIREFERLASGTREWVETYYDSTLPRWILDRSAVATNTLQTQNCLILDDGRFWAWEGIGCCAGTCGHVWHYAQGPAALFPSLERNLREVTDYGVAQNPDGAVRFRAESGGIAIDSQAGLILRTWREHRHSGDDAFLRRVWPGAKKALGWLIAFDNNDPDGLDGLLHGRQHNTLDAEWYGKVHALCSLYLAALRAGEEMAREMGDDAFSRKCRKVFKSGSTKISELFNGEFYEQQEDPKHLAAIGVGKGCYIDQVIGQWWAHQTGLGRIYDGKQIQSALHSLWKYNFLPDVGPFRQQFKRGRFYALPGDAGLVMCTWPKGGLREDFMKHWQYAYFNECMTGFEWQVAAHMVMEGAPVSGTGFEKALEDPSDPRSLTLRGLAVARAIHDRYAPAGRNPYNEIECSDHYARAAASYSLLLGVCGFQYHGPTGEIGFAPKLNPEKFRAPFTAAEGWGTFAQTKAADGTWSARISVRHGQLRLNSIRLPWLGKNPRVEIDGSALKLRRRDAGQLTLTGQLTLAEALILQAGQSLTITS